MTIYIIGTTTCAVLTLACLAGMWLHDRSVQREIKELLNEIP